MRDKAYTIFLLRKRNFQSKQFEVRPHLGNEVGMTLLTTMDVRDYLTIWVKGCCCAKEWKKGGKK